MSTNTGGVTWSTRPTLVHALDKPGDNWYVVGVKQLRILSQGGWRTTKKTVHLQENGSWEEGAHHFTSKDLAEKAFSRATAETKPHPSPSSHSLPSVIRSSASSVGRKRW
jgi:hypothetical protein